MPWTVPWNLIGLEVSGDVGPLTIYRNKNRKKVAFPKDFRQEQASEARLRQRERFRQAQANWKALTDEEKQALEACAHTLSLCATGQNVYISVSLRHDQSGYTTLSRQSGIELPPFTPIPY